MFGTPALMERRCEDFKDSRRRGWVKESCGASPFELGTYIIWYSCQDVSIDWDSWNQLECYGHTEIGCNSTHPVSAIVPGQF